MTNKELKKDDIIVLLHMDGESIPPGTIGLVEKRDVVMGDVQYSVKWIDNEGNIISKLSLISGIDKWMLKSDFDNLIEKKKNRNIKESDRDIERHESLYKNKDVFENFNVSFLKKYLLMIRDSGIVNMFSSSPLLYSGKKSIESQFSDSELEDNEDFQKVLKNADKSQLEMYKGVSKILENEGKEINLENVNRYLRKYSTKVLMTYIDLLS